MLLILSRVKWYALRSSIFGAGGIGIGLCLNPLSKVVNSPECSNKPGTAITCVGTTTFSGLLYNLLNVISLHVVLGCFIETRKTFFSGTLDIFLSLSDFLTPEFLGLSGHLVTSTILFTSGGLN